MIGRIVAPSVLSVGTRAIGAVQRWCPAPEKVDVSRAVPRSETFTRMYRAKHCVSPDVSSLQQSAARASPVRGSNQGERTWALTSPMSFCGVSRRESVECAASRAAGLAITLGQCLWVQGAGDDHRVECPETSDVLNCQSLVFGWSARGRRAGRVLIKQGLRSTTGDDRRQSVCWLPVLSVCVWIPSIGDGGKPGLRGSSLTSSGAFGWRARRDAEGVASRVQEHEPPAICLRGR